MSITSNRIYGFQANSTPTVLDGYKSSDLTFVVPTGAFGNLVGKFVWSYRDSDRMLGSWGEVASNDATSVTLVSGQILKPHANHIEIYDNKNATKVLIESPHGLRNSNMIEIIRTDEYMGTYAISNVQSASFDIDKPYTNNNISTQPIWQLARASARPTVVMPEAETIDTLRQGVNIVSSDLGDKTDLKQAIRDRRDAIKAINSIYDLIDEELLKSLILSIATN